MLGLHLLYQSLYGMAPTGPHPPQPQFPNHCFMGSMILYMSDHMGQSTQELTGSIIWRTLTNVWEQNQDEKAVKRVLTVSG